MTDVYCDWFASLPPEVAKELAVLLMRLFPGGLLEPTLATPSVTDGLVPRMRRLGARTAGAAMAGLGVPPGISGAGTPDYADAGTALTLAGLTDFVMAERGDPEHWSVDRDRLELLDEARAALGDQMDAEVAEWVAQNRLRYPLRAKQWEKAAASWASLRAGPLSDGEIRAALSNFSVHS